MKVACIGGGPAGLYFTISMKLRDPSHQITVYERNAADDTFGWGVVFSDQTLDNLRKNDATSAEQILSSFAHWDDIDVHFRGQTITSSGHGFCGIARVRLLRILQDRARELGVDLRFGHEVESVESLGQHDLVVAADGINSKVRAAHDREFECEEKLGANKFIWLGTHQVFDAFTFAFEETEHGWIWAHAYRFDETTSTFIVECQEHTWKALGFDTLGQQEGIELCERLFAKYLGGHRLMCNAKHLTGLAWLKFPKIDCKRWHINNVVLMGDAAHTAHFSIGSGTKLALEDAIGLANALHDASHPTLADSLAAYEDVRRVEVLKLQSAARNSTEWFENVPRYTHFEPLQFAYALLTRSQRVSHENLRLRDKSWLEGMERWFASTEAAVPPMFVPYAIRGMHLENRVVVSPMATYSAVDGIPNDFHLVHYGARAQGGAGLIFTEMTCVTSQGRITPGCTGMYCDAHLEAWKRIVDFVHERTPAKFGLQLGHSGPRGSTKVLWEGDDEPLDHANWPLLAPSELPWSSKNQTPVSMTRNDMDLVKAAFVNAAQMGLAAGFDMLELHYAHGYLMSSFITPLWNRRDDEYGGSLENRLRYPIEVFSAVRAVWPDEKPMSVRISATDWMGHEGITPDDAVEIARAFKAAGADLMDVSAGQTSTVARPVYGRMFQTPFSDRIRNEAGIATMAVGNIFEFDHVNSILASGRADLCCLARPHLADPYWTLHAAAMQNYRDVSWPVQYESGRNQLYRNLERMRLAK